MYKCDKCICVNCKNYFENNGDCEQCLMCGISINTSNIYSLLFLSQTFSIFIIIFNILTNTIINILKSDEKVKILKI